MKATIISLMTLVTLLASPSLCLDTADGPACCKANVQDCQRQKFNGCIRAGSGGGVCVVKGPTQECQDTCRAKGYSKWYKSPGQ
jgi:hypothetical protein